MAKVSPTTIEGNNVIDCHLDCEFPVFLVKITNKDWDECGKFDVVTDCGWNAIEGWREFDHQYFDTLEAARFAFDDRF